MLVTTLSVPTQTPRLQPAPCHVKDRVILALDFLLGTRKYKKTERCTETTRIDSCSAQ